MFSDMMSDSTLQQSFKKISTCTPHSTPTTAAAIILANFALAMWTVGWFLLYFVALSNIS